MSEFSDSAAAVAALLPPPGNSPSASHARIPNATPAMSSNMAARYPRSATDGKGGEPLDASVKPNSVACPIR